MTFESSGEFKPMDLNDLERDLEDDQYQLLAERIGPKKKGRPAHLPSLVVNNRLLLQLNVLKNRGRTWAEVQSLFSDICRHQIEPVPTCSVEPLIRTCLRQFSQTASPHVETFLSIDKDIAWIGPYSKQHQVSKAFLLSEKPCREKKLSYIPVGLMLELDTFRGQMKLEMNKLCFWVKCLSDDINFDTAVKANKLLHHLRGEVKKKQIKRKKTSDGETILQNFLDAPCEISNQSPVPSSEPSPCPESSKTHSTPTLSSPLITSDSSSKTQLSEGQCQCHAMVKALQCTKSNLESEMSIKIAEVEALREVVAEKKEKISSLEKQIHEQAQTIARLLSSVRDSKSSENLLKTKLAEKRRECTSLHQQNLYRQNCRQKKKLEHQSEQLAHLTAMNEELQEAKACKRRYQVFASQTQAKKRKVDEKLREANNTIQELQQEMSETTVKVPETRNEKGHFTEPVIKCVMELIGECEVPARRCNNVMMAVSRHLFCVDMPEHSLPSKTSSLRFADQTHGLAKMHIAEELSNKRYDLHADGTSRNTKKYVGFQVTLEDKKTLSLGFDPVARETAQTLLDLAIDRLSELAVLHADSGTELNEILKNMVGVMSDRASTMKSFDQKLSDYRSSRIDENVQLEFLHCNAHFLLGLTTAAEKALATVATEKNLAGQLGRDSMAAFRNFRSVESAVCRYVRMACDTLGPRGDEQCGCHHYWVAFCNAQEKDSLITSFRSNRFNNLFNAAAGLIHHREDIVHFFQVRPPTNLKQKSVLADASCDTLVLMLLGLALMYIYFSGPFWIFINSDVHYLDQYQFIQPMYQHLKDVQSNPDLLLSEEDIPYELECFRLAEKKYPQVKSVLAFRSKVFQNENNKELLQLVLKTVSAHFVKVCDNQLGDFLQGGKYGSPPTEEARNRMQHCQLTNLLGEACFADLDYSMFKNRRARLHHHSTINMGKRNKPVSSWLLSKSQEQQSALLAKAKKLGPQMRQKHNQQEQLVLEELQGIMEQQKTANEEKERQHKLEKRRVYNEIQEQGGACKSRQGVQVLLERFHTKAEKMNALKLQIKFLKLFFNAKDDRLIVRNLQPCAVAENLISYIEEYFGVGQEPAHLQESDSSTEEEPQEPDHSALLEHEINICHQSSDNESDCEFSFHFSSQGQSVAVFYDDAFYIGQVLEMVRPDLACISFMDQKGTENLFRWPLSDSIGEVESKYVFYSDFNILPKNRVWSIDYTQWGTLKRRYKQYVKKYC